MDRTVLLTGILINSRTAAFYTVFGALLPIPPAFLPGIDAGTLNMGLMGYNGVLSVVLQIIGMNLGITTLTAPFVISVWVIMGIQKLMILQQYTKRF